MPGVRTAIRTGALAAAVAAGAVLAGADIAFATTDTTFGDPLDTVQDIVGGTGGQLAAALAVGAALGRFGAALQRHAADGRGRRRHRGGRGHRHCDQPGRHGDRLMSESARHTIPRRLDDPERWLFWTVDEAAALMGPALLGLAANQFVPGLIAGVGGWLVLRRVKRGGGANIARYALYWFLPDFVLRLKATPPSHLRRFVG